MHTPLADQIRPSTLDDVVGQRQLLAAGKPLRRIIESGKIPNMIFYGPSGVGKTTVARIIADSTSMTLHKLNGTSASTADIRDVVAEVGTFSGMNGILLYLDEIQYFNKKQQQLLLEYMENGQITLIASTTENPYFAVYNALISRSTVFEFKPVSPEELERAVARGFRCMEQQLGETIHLSDGVCGWIARGCGGDVRKAMNTVELIVLSGEHTENGIVISDELAQELTQRSNMRYDRDNDQHYDLLSALQKSICCLSAGGCWSLRQRTWGWHIRRQLSSQRHAWTVPSSWGYPKPVFPLQKPWCSSPLRQSLTVPTKRSIGQWQTWKNTGHRIFRGIYRINISTGQRQLSAGSTTAIPTTIPTTMSDSSTCRIFSRTRSITSSARTGRNRLRQPIGKKFCGKIRRKDFTLFP